MKAEAQKELLALAARKKGGKLQPSEIVEYARDEETALHECFEWNDSAAAVKHRIWQARMLIRAVVVIEPQTERHIKPLWSLASDRKGGGYRTIEAIVKSPTHRESMVNMALTELRRWCTRFETIGDLSLLVTSVERAAIEFENQRHAQPPVKRSRKRELVA